LTVNTAASASGVTTCLVGKPLHAAWQQATLSGVATAFGRADH
jgi:hypothetical protein